MIFTVSSCLMILLVFLTEQVTRIIGFTVIPVTVSTTNFLPYPPSSSSPRQRWNALKAGAESSPTPLSPENDEQLQQQQQRLKEIFPVISRIHGINWEGTCRYVNGDLQPQTNLLLTGGTRYDLKLSHDNDDDNDKSNNDDPTKATCTLTSFLVFPNGKTRQVQMVGQRGSLQRSSIRLDPTLPSTDGPIYMVLTELPPDTILLNEIEKATGKIILTASISLSSRTSGSVGDAGIGGSGSNVVDELIQVSHEVGSGSNDNKKEQNIIEGHQVWRLKKRRQQQPLSASSASASSSASSSSSLEARGGEDDAFQ